MSSPILDIVLNEQDIQDEYENRLMFEDIRRELQEEQYLAEDLLHSGEYDDYVDEHPDCIHCPHPCDKCKKACFHGKCYDCFPERVIPCKSCGERMFDGECDCLTEQVEDEVLEHEV